MKKELAYKDAIYVAGVSYFIEKQINKGINSSEEMLGKIEEAKNNPDIKLELPEHLVYVDGFVNENGTSASAFMVKDENGNDTNKVIIGCAGTSLRTTKDLWADYSIFTEGFDYEKYLKPTMDFVDRIEKQGYEIQVMTGHSLGGSIADYVGTYHNLDIVTYNSAPTSFSSEGMIKGLLTFDLGSLLFQLLGIGSALFASIDVINKTNVRIENRKEYLELLGKYTGKKYRFNSENDLLNLLCDIFNGRYDGKEIILKNSGIHFLDDFKKEQMMKYYEIIFKCDFDRLKEVIIIDFNDDGNIELTYTFKDKRNLFTKDLALINPKEDIKLDVEMLLALSDNIRNTVNNELNEVERIINLCKDKNNNLQINYINRNENAKQMLKEMLYACGFFEILGLLHQSIFQIYSNQHLISDFPISIIDDSRLDSNEELDCWEMKDLINLSNKFLNDTKDFFYYAERQKVNSLGIEGTENVIKSWELIQKRHQEILDQSEYLFQGEGFRHEYQDGLVDALKVIFEINLQNTQELKRKFENTSNIVKTIGENFTQLDQALAKLNEIKPIEVQTVEASYQAKLERDYHFADCKNVIDAFNKQVEDKSEYLANLFVNYYQLDIVELRKTINDFIELIEVCKNRSDQIENELKESIKIKNMNNEYRQISKNQIISSDFLKYYQDFRKEVISHLETIEGIYPVIDLLANNISDIKNNSKYMLETLVYAQNDLDEINLSHRVISDILNNLEEEIIYVKQTIEKENKTEAIKILLEELENLKNNIYNFKDFVIDCFN